MGLNECDIDMTLALRWILDPIDPDSCVYQHWPLTITRSTPVGTLEKKEKEREGEGAWGKTGVSTHPIPHIFLISIPN